MLLSQNPIIQTPVALFGRCTAVPLIFSALRSVVGMGAADLASLAVASPVESSAGIVESVYSQTDVGLTLTVRATSADTVRFHSTREDFSVMILRCLFRQRAGGVFAQHPRNDARQNHVHRVRPQSRLVTFLILTVLRSTFNSDLHCFRSPESMSVIS